MVFPIGMSVDMSQGNTDVTKFRNSGKINRKVQFNKDSRIEYGHTMNLKCLK